MKRQPKKTVEDVKQLLGMGTKEFVDYVIDNYCQEIRFGKSGQTHTFSFTDNFKEGKNGTLTFECIVVNDYVEVKKVPYTLATPNITIKTTLPENVPFEMKAVNMWDKQGRGYLFLGESVPAKHCSIANAYVAGTSIEKAMKRIAGEDKYETLANMIRTGATYETVTKTIPAILTKEQYEELDKFSKWHWQVWDEIFNLIKP